MNEIVHYRIDEKDTDGNVKENWFPIYEVEDFNDVVEFEKLMSAKRNLKL